MSILRVFFSFEAILLITGLRSYDFASQDTGDAEQSSINALREVIVSETLQTFVPPEFIRMAYYLFIDKYGDYHVAQHVVQYLLGVGRTNFSLDEDEILEQASNLCSHSVDFEDVRCLLWAKALNVDAFVTCKGEEFQRIIDCCKNSYDLTEVPILSIRDFLNLSLIKECLSEGESRISVFTPNRQAITLPVDATPVDFAYRIHTEVGNRCNQALVNDLAVSLETKLKNGDIVRIITDRSAQPNQDWLDFVVTKTAKNGIRRKLKDIEIQKGRIAIESILDEPVSGIRGELQEIARLMSHRNINNLLRDLGSNSSNLEKVRRLLGRIRYRKIYEQVLLGTSDDVLLIDRDNRNYKFATCCKPSLDGLCKGVLGRSNYPIRVHRNDCLSLENLNPARISPITWDFNDCRVFLEIKMKDREGAFLSVADILRRNSISFDIRQIRTYSDQTTAKVRIATTTKSKQQLDDIVKLIEPMDIVLRTRVVGLMPVES